MDAGAIAVALVQGLVLALMGLAGWLIGRTRNRPVLGFWLAILLGPLGWLVVALLPRKDITRRDPEPFGRLTF